MATSPLEPPGTVDVTVSTPNGTSTTSPADQFIFVAPGPPPTVTSVTPNAGTTAGGTSFTVTGTGFTGVSAVDVGKAPATFVVNSDTSLTAISPQEVAATYDVTTTNPNGTSATGIVDQFAVVAPQPVVTSVSPATGTADGGAVVTISGTGFTFASAVSFGGVPAASFVVNSDTTVTATSPAQPVGSVDITVTTAGGTSATSPSDLFSVVTPPLLVTGVSPASGSTLGGTHVTVTGSGFTGATIVDFGSTSTPFSVTSDTSLTAVAPPEAAGKVNVTVTTPGGTSPVDRATDRFDFVPPPIVGHVSPSKGPALGGTTVNVSGRDFTGATAVDFGGVPAASFVVNSSHSISATTPPEAPGATDVTVTTPSGTSGTSPGSQYTFTTPRPVVTSISPATGSTLGGTIVTITGSNFTGAFAVHFGSSPAVIATVESDTVVKATSPPGTPGTVPLTVTSTSGTSHKTSTARFSYTERVTTPVVTAVSPQAVLTGTPKNPNSVTITGSGFSGATSVHFGQVAASSFNVASDSAIFATVPPNAMAQTVDITITTPVATSVTRAEDLFTYVAPGPVATVSGVSPSSGPNSGGTQVVITGTGVGGATAVSFGTVSVPFLLDTTTGGLLATAPPGPLGPVDVTVTTPNGVSATNIHDTFTYTRPQNPPTLTKVRPASGPSAGGTKVIITGNGFVGATAVDFGTVPAAFVVHSNAFITATSPDEQPGTVDVTVTTPNGITATGPIDQFTFKPPR